MISLQSSKGFDVFFLIEIKLWLSKEAMECACLVTISAACLNRDIDEIHCPYPNF